MEKIHPEDQGTEGFLKLDVAEGQLYFRVALNQPNGDVVSYGLIQKALSMAQTYFLRKELQRAEMSQKAGVILPNGKPSSVPFTPGVA